MPDEPRWQSKPFEFQLWGRYALFTDPLTRVGGEKCSYHLPTYEGLKGICKSIYWKPTLIWFIDEVRLMRRIRTQTRGMKPLEYTSGGNTLAIYTYLTGDARGKASSESIRDLTEGPGVEYQVRAHFEWNLHQAALAADRVEAKHAAIAQRSLERGGRQDVFLGTRECQGYVAPCVFGEDEGDYDNDGELDYALMFHSFNYPDETGAGRLGTNFWRPRLQNGILRFPRPDDTSGRIVHKDIRAMQAKQFGLGENVARVEVEAAVLETETGALL